MDECKDRFVLLRDVIGSLLLSRNKERGRSANGVASERTNVARTACGISQSDKTLIRSPCVDRLTIAALKKTIILGDTQGIDEIFEAAWSPFPREEQGVT
jgi:hypothetical protein